MTTASLPPLRERARLALLEGELHAWKLYALALRRVISTALRLLLAHEHRAARPEYPQEVLKLLSEGQALPGPQS